MNARSLEQRAASRFVVGFDGTALSPDLEALLKMGVAGVILFRRNVVEPRQVAELNARILRAAGRPIFVSADQEGGPVQRLRAPFTEFPAHGVLGAIDDPKLTAKVAKVIATEMRALGFNADYAPLADVNTNPANPVIGIRSFGADPALVGRHVKAWVLSMQKERVLACAKHFPGHGDTTVDSHYDLPVVAHGAKRMREVELAPFRIAIAARVGSIMTAHVVFESLDPGVPATLSKKALTGLLRRKMKFGGLIVSDDLEMKAIADRVGVAEAAVQSIRAGADLLLVCKTRERILESIERVAKAIEAKKIADGGFEKRISLARVRYGIRPPDPAKAMRVVGRAGHRKIAEEVSRRAAKAGVTWTPSAAVAASPVSTT